MNLHRIQLDVGGSNERGRRAYEAVGYRREGVFRDAIFCDGSYTDVHRMAILADEWKARAAKG